jgi:hypothetical protein
MKRFKIEQSDMKIASQPGLALIAQAIKRHSHLKSQADNSVTRRHRITHSGVLNSYLGLLCVSKNVFEAINNIDSDFFQSTLDVDKKPSEAMLRQRMDRYATKILADCLKGELGLSSQFIVQTA